MPIALSRSGLATFGGDVGGFVEVISCLCDSCDFSTCLSLCVVLIGVNVAGGEVGVLDGNGNTVGVVSERDGKVGVMLLSQFEFNGKAEDTDRSKFC